MRMRPAIIISWLVIVFTGIYANFIFSVEPVPIRKSLIYFPFKIGEWKGVEKANSNYVMTTLGADDILLREYENINGDRMELYFSYYDYITSIHDKPAKMPHAPQVCWIGKGWVFKDLGDERLGFKVNGKTVNVKYKKILAEKQDKEVLLFYFFKLNDHYAVNWPRIRIYAFIDSILKHKNSTLTLQLSAVVDRRGSEYKEKEMKDFLAKVIFLLEKEYLP